MIGADAFEGQFTGGVHDIARRFGQLFVYGKFYPIFSFLFGVGIAMQANQTTRHDWKAFHARRMTVLFLFGLMHISLLWSGDVLHLYAVLGMIAIPLLRMPRWLLVSAACLTLGFPFYDNAFAWLSSQLQYAPENFLSQDDASLIREVFVSGITDEMIRVRWLQYASDLPTLLLHLLPNAFAMLMLGIAFAKSRALDDPPSFARQIALPVLAVTGLVTTYRVWFLFFLWDTPLWADEAWRPALVRVMDVCDSVTGLFYLWILSVAQSNALVARVSAWLMHVGRMALTNYLLQSTIGLLLFTGCGLAYYETFSPATLFGIVWAVILAQLIWSHYWFQLFQFGPFEWLWRCISYGRIFRITAN